jgi:DNA polymerase I-like protein with 3'-5' exonuclease and polymerase domains/uracil-DNA glycosylase
LVRGAGDNPAHLIIVGRSPSGFSIGKTLPFQGADGRLFNKLLATVVDNNKEKFTGLKVYRTYSVLVGAVKPTLQHAKSCGAHLQAELQSVAGVGGKEPVLITLGPEAARAVGLRFAKIDDIVGRLLTVTLQSPQGPRTLSVLPLISMVDLARRPGVVSVVSSSLVSALDRALGVEVTSVLRPPGEYPCPQTIEELTTLVDTIIGYTGKEGTAADNWPISIDTETNTLNMHEPTAKVLMLSVGWDVQKSATILLDHAETPYEPKEAWAQVARLLGCPKPKVFQNAKFDLKGLEINQGLIVNRLAWDVMLGEHWLDEDKKGLYGLKKMCALYVPGYTGYDEDLQLILRGEVQKSEDAEGNGQDSVVTPSPAPKKQKKQKKKKSSGFENIPLKTIINYAATDTDVTWQIFTKQYARISRLGLVEEAQRVMKELYLKGTRPLAKMEHHGIQIDTAYLETLDADVCKLRDESLQCLRREFEPAANYASPAQISAMMVRLNFDPLPGKEQGCTDKETMARYVTRYGVDDKRGRFAEKSMMYRAANDAQNKFLAKIHSYVESDNRIHCSFHLGSTATGRLSSSHPNLQNIPKQILRTVRRRQDGSEEVVHPGFNAKKLFIPSRPGNVLCNVDIKGAELRVYTAYSHDQKMIDLLAKGIDVHSVIAAEAYGIPYETIKANKDKDPGIAKKRLSAKRVVFGTFYGAGANKIAQQIESTREEGQRLIDLLFNMFPALHEYVESTKQEVRDYQYVKTLFGRYRRFKLAHLGEAYLQTAFREAVNMKIQSTTSDLVLSQLCEVDEHLKELDATMLITVHDSMLFELPEKNVPLLRPFLTKWITERVKEKYVWLPLPFLFDYEVGPNYGEVKEMK